MCPCSVNPKQCLVGVMASLRRIWFCHGKGRGFLTSKFFFWESDDSKESAPAHPTVVLPGVAGDRAVTVVWCTPGKGWDVMEVS